MTKEITDEQFWQLVGLMALAKEHVQKLEDIRSATHSVVQVKPSDEEISGIGDPEHIGDAIYSGYSVNELLQKLGIKRQEPA